MVRICLIPLFSNSISVARQIRSSLVDANLLGLLPPVASA